MKYIITESQHKRLFEEEQKILRIPDFKIFGNDWDILQRFLESKGNPPYSLGGNLDLVGLKVESLGNLVSVEHDLYAYDTPLKSLGSLTSVGGLMDLSNTQIESLGNLSFVGGSLVLKGTPLFPKDASPRSKQRMEDTIHQTVYVQGNILYYY
jgi:hypothetical protein